MNNVTQIMESFVQAGLFPSSGSGISLCYLVNVYKAEQDNAQLNKSVLIASIPNRLGSLTRKRAVLDKLIYGSTLSESVGKKKSEKFIHLTEKSKPLLKECRK
jgi:hypothetical protein